MFWVTRKGRRYLYECRREGRQVRKVYLGCGPLAEHLMARAQEVRAASEAPTGTATGSTDEELWTEAERLTEEFTDEVSALTRAALVAAGYRRHSRGEWRMKRAGQAETTIGTRKRGSGAGPLG
jgi:hypothetical protein